MEKRVIPVTQYSKVRLRLLEEKDLPLTLEWRNQYHIRRWFFNSVVIQPEAHNNWYRQYSGRDDDFVFIIEDIQDDYRPIGQIAIYHINWQEQKAEYGRLMIGESSASGKGLAHDATKAVLQIAFEYLELKEVYLEVFSNNTKAIAVYKKAGFKVTSQDNHILHMKIFALDFLDSPAAKGTEAQENRT
jgi:RimJ/RimL family protein N-acetyltransferase